MAILSGDAKAISKAQGIGAKTAQRIIIELKDKIDINQMIGMSEPDRTDINPTVQSDVVEALAALGYSRTDALQAVRKINITEQTDVEEALKLALKHMM